MRNTVLGKLIVLLLVIFASQQLFSQNNIIEATLMTKDGTELKGYINYQQWEISPKSIEFYKTPESKKTVYSVKNSDWFKVSNDFYKRREITYTKSPRNSSNLSYNKTYPEYTEDAFCLVLIEGKTSLYKFVDKWSITHFFIEKEDQGISELVYYRYFIKQGANKQKAIAENNKYQGQLNYLLADCPDVKKKATSIDYNAKPLKKLVTEYNQCHDNTITYTKKTEKTKVIFGVTAGVSFTNVKFSDSDPTFYFVTHNDHKTSINPTLGVSIYIIPERGLEKWVFYADLIYKSHYFEESYYEYNNDDYYIDLNYSFGATYLKLSPMVRFNFVGSKLIPYLGGGIYLSKTIMSQNTKTKDTKFYNQFTSVTSPLFQNGIRGYDYGLLAEGGIYYQKFNLGVRYEIGGVGGMNSYTQTFYVLLSYLF